MSEIQTEAEVEVMLAPSLQPILAPISPSNPCGEDVTYDDDFQRLKLEIDGMSSVSAEAGADFQVVVELAQKVLATKSKDLRAACYLAMGLERTEGLSGLAEGITAVHLLTATFWDGMYPPLRRIAARQNALQGLADRLKERLADYKPVVEDRKTLERAIASTRDLMTFAGAAMGENAPMLSGLSQALDESLRRVLKEQAPPPAATPSEAKPVPATPQPGGPSAVSIPAAEQELTPAAADNLILRCADFLRECDETDAVPYRLARVQKWSHMHVEPPADDGRALLEGPPQPRIAFLNRLLSEGQFPLLIAESEASFHEYPFWLDLQRFIVAGMDGIGPGYESARDAVLLETAMLLKRLPGLMHLRFTDETPFADPATQGWIEMRVMTVFGADSSSGSALMDSGGSALAEQYGAARDLLGSGDLAGALTAMREGAGQERSRSEGFRRQFYIATLCMSGGRMGLARPVLEGLSDDISRFALDEWDPVLALDVWTSLYRCYHALGSSREEAGEEWRNKADAVFERICRLDIEQGLALAGA